MFTNEHFVPFCLFIKRLSIKKMKKNSELVRLMPDISERMISKQLKELEKDSLIHRQVFPEVPPRVEYSLTKLGKDIHPVLKGMYKGGLLFENSIESVD